MRPTVGCIYTIPFFCNEAKAAKTAQIRNAASPADVEDAFTACWTEWMEPCSCLKCAEIESGITEFFRALNTNTDFNLENVL